MVKFSYKLVKTDKIVRKDENKHKIIELIPHNDITKEELIDLLKTQVEVLQVIVIQVEEVIMLVLQTRVNLIILILVKVVMIF